MNRQNLLFSTGIGVIILFISIASCKKINEATELGAGLVPAVDNVHTFEVALNTVTQTHEDVDTTEVLYNDYVALGDITDPEFGHTHANIAVSLNPQGFGVYPFVNKDSLNIDSVVLSLSYEGAYGDTLVNDIQTVRVFEVSPSSSFSDTGYYKYSDPSTDFATTGVELGATTFSIRNLRDTVKLIRGTDTSAVSNVLRIKLDNSLGIRLSQYDTTNAYKNDSIFNQLFRGLSIKADPVGNALSYFNLADVSNSKLTVYFRYGKKDTLSYDFSHLSTRGQANYVERQNGGNYLTALGNGASDIVYLQSAPGSHVTIAIPSLSTFANKVIHRAEIIAYKIPSASDNIFSAPIQMLLARTNSFTPDTLFMLQNDLVADASGNVDFSSFGGTLKSDNTVRFNVSRYVQSVVTKHLPNDTLVLSAPVRAAVFNTSFGIPITFRVIEAIAKGRLVLGGGTYADPARQLKLRIIYSDL